jgi:hypothetical protein
MGLMLHRKDAICMPDNWSKLELHIIYNTYYC